jgi:hypothetical protein
MERITLFSPLSKPARKLSQFRRRRGRSARVSGSAFFSTGISQGRAGPLPSIAKRGRWHSWQPCDARDNLATPSASSAISASIETKRAICEYFNLVAGDRRHLSPRIEFQVVSGRFRATRFILAAA